MTTPIILAAGLGTRMKSSVPKVLHHVGGQSMISRVVEVAFEATGFAPLVVYSSGTAQIKEFLGDQARFVLQVEQRGTGDAVASALAVLPSSVEEVVVLYGDTPLIQATTVRQLIQERKDHGAVLSLAAFHLADPTGYGRLLQDQEGGVIRIVEEKDASLEERQCTLVNAGLYCFETIWLRDAIRVLQPSHATGELYLTDLVSIAHGQGRFVWPHIAVDGSEFQGVNTPEQLAQAERFFHQKFS